MKSTLGSGPHNDANLPLVHCVVCRCIRHNAPPAWVSNVPTRSPGYYSKAIAKSIYLDAPLHIFLVIGVAS